MKGNTKKVKKRKIPFIKVDAIPGESFEKVAQHPVIKHVIINELVIAIEDGLNKNKNSVVLFKISDSDLCVELDKSNWSSSLNNALNYFIEKEDYIKCAEIRDLINKI